MQTSEFPFGAQFPRANGYDGWLTWREIRCLRHFRSEGKTVEQIHQLTGCSCGTISRHTADLGPRKKWNHRTTKQESQIIELSKDHSQKQIAKIVGVGTWTVHDVQKKSGVGPAFRRSADSARFRYAFNEHEFGEIVERLYFKEYMSLQEVAKTLGLNTQTTRRRMVKLGFRIRNLKESRSAREERKRYLSENL